MNIHAAAELFAYGTSEGAQKAWDTRGRGSKIQVGHKVSINPRVGGGHGHIESLAPSGHFAVVRHSNGDLKSYHESDLKVTEPKNYQSHDYTKQAREFKKQHGDI